MQHNWLRFLYIGTVAVPTTIAILLAVELRDQYSINGPLFDAVKRYQSTADKWKTMYDMALVFNQATDNDLRVCKSMLGPEQRQSFR